MKQRKSPPPALSQELEFPATGLGFTVWVHLPRPASVSEVRLYRHGLDRYIEANGLSRSMNPLHMLVWASDRSLTLTDQIDLLVWMVRDGRAVAVEMGPLQTQMGLPAGRDLVPTLPVRLADNTLLSMVRLYGAGHLPAEEFIEMLGGFQGPVTLH
ncbi:hypothetical protein HZ992_16540 [Rhizobacter sp. AJA081-3]|uniref:hypothetical protein n=1 Tax=Rhizobacter sp. AJA081-3 TaxID=2753607 RepID=UPI001ADFD4F2|nr:hypothetical protein [Rhizobacter sp. AJA081-3]QTN21774.1 hypothetical protein HZ992_16540 [Rhizobacter sp. AJA081-3]